MSVTILTLAPTHTPVYNNQNLVASSTNSTQTNFKYVVTIEINNGTFVPNTTLKIPPRPDNSKLYFNPQKIVESQVTSYFDTTALDFYTPQITIPSAMKKVVISVAEEYGSPVSGFGGASGTYYVWNGAYDSLDFADYIYSTSTSSKDLTLSPGLTDTIHFDQKYLYKTWHRGFSTRDNRYLNITAYDSSGAIVQTALIENTLYNVGGSFQRNYTTLNVSPYGLNNYVGVITSQSVVGPLVPATTVRYTFYFTNTIGDVSSGANTVYIDDFCSIYDRYVLHFLNKLGNYDSFTFNLLSRSKTDKDADSYKKIPYTLNSGNYYRYEKYTNDTVVYNTVLTNKLTMNSNWVDDAKALWLRDLFTSPDVKLEIPDNPNIVGSQATLISVKVSEKSYETKKQANDKLFNIVIEVENSLQDTRQRA